MKHPEKMLWALAIGTSVLALAVTMPRALAARASARSEVAALRTTTSNAREIVDLRSRLSTVAMTGDPKRTLAERVARVLADAGIPGSALASLSPESQPARGASGFDQALLIRRRATMTLASITLPQLGRFLDAWGHRQPAWTVTNIDIAPDQRGSVTPGGDLPLRAVIVIESMTPNGSTP